MTTVATGNRRLLKLAEFLDALPRKRFDYTSWVGADWGGAPDLSCGTTACAGGWATAMPAFRRLGLHMERIDEDSGTRLRLANKYDFYALSDIFGLNLSGAFRLFLPLQDEYRATPKQVARKIRRFVKARS